MIKLPTTKQKILRAATDCFFQHGYNAANISMISRYAGISRVTIHKLFCSKEKLFKNVVQHHFDESKKNLDHYTKSSDNFWAETETLLLELCHGIFDDVSSTLIRADLIHAGQIYCSVIIQNEEKKIRDAIEQRLIEEVDNQRISFQAIDMMPKTVALLIQSVPIGLAVTTFEDNQKILIHNLMQIFKAATRLT